MKTKRYLMGLSLAMTLVLSSCGQKATTEEAVETTTTTMEDKSFDPSEYTAGVITETKEEGNCQWVIKLKDGRIFETTDMNKDFKKNGAAVYFKFRGLRRMSLCPGANPVEITEMRMAKK